MDMSGCQAAFPESELGRLLSTKSLGLYHRLQQARDLELAEIEGLESCPVCPFAAIVDDPNDKLFRCMNEECGQVTCRKCRNKEHIPKTCEETAADRKLDKRHTVEDAMSEALIRKCPKCSKPFIKDFGCNKICCFQCGAISCYICRKPIQGYDHFDQTPEQYQRPKQAGKCPLWDGSERKLDDEAILAARDEAQERARAAAAEEGVQLAEEDLNVDMPNALNGPLARLAPHALPAPPAPDVQALGAPHRGHLHQAGLNLAQAFGYPVGPGVPLQGALPLANPFYVPPIQPWPVPPPGVNPRQVGPVPHPQRALPARFPMAGGRHERNFEANVDNDRPRRMARRHLPPLQPGPRHQNMVEIEERNWVNQLAEGGQGIIRR
ncbi:hypothetical protein IAR55_002076 [Kwoniella newhampshirensis]|uniref:RING-type domain-containing protein n=1 Tax=Kwoniella newhampshirensis TaxID=1651941 RepID=A0AAW0Z0T9_9TREE